MSVFNFQVVETGSPFPKVKASNTLAADFLSIAIGADNLPIVQAGTGGTAYFDFGARKITSSFTAVGANDLTNKGSVDSLISTAAALKLSLTGGTMSGAIAMGTNKITGLGNGTAASQDAATVSQMETADALKLSLTGGTMSGAIAMGASKITGLANGSTASQDAATVAQVESLISAIPSADLTPYFKKDGTVTATGNFNMGGSYKIGSLADPTVAQDAATKAYVDAVALGLAPKKAVIAATVANIDLSTALINSAVVDGVTLTTGDRVLVMAQTLPAENGIYIVAASGAASRSTDMDSLTPIDEVNGAWVPVQQGTANLGKIFVQYGVVATLGTSAVNFEFYNPLAQLVGGDMITNSGSTFSIDLATDAGLESSNPGNAGGQLRAKLDGSTLARASTGLKVADAGITATQIAASVAGAGLAGGAGTALSVNVGNGLKILSDNVEVDYASAKTNDNAGAIVAGKVVYIKANGNVDLASKANAISDTELGFVQDASIASAASGAIIFKRGAHISGFSGLTPGAEYYVAGAGLMDLYANITYAATENVYSLGKALDATTLIYNPSYKFQF